MINDVIIQVSGVLNRSTSRSHQCGCSVTVKDLHDFRPAVSIVFCFIHHYVTLIKMSRAYLVFRIITMVQLGEKCSKTYDG